MRQPFTVYDLILGYGRAVDRGDDGMYIQMVDMLHTAGFLDYEEYNHIYQYFRRLYKRDGQIRDCLTGEVALVWCWEDATMNFHPNYAKKVVNDLYAR